MKETNIVIGGDLCPVNRNTACFQKGDPHSLFDGLFGEFEAADLALVNLECPLIERPSPIAKTGPVLGAPVECVNGIVRSRIRAVGLANNHILDHGAAGVESTLRSCAAAGINTFGAGRNLEEAGRILIEQTGDLRIGLLGVCVQEWSIATSTTPGANPLDLIDCVRTLKAHKEAVDFLIVLLHDGAEYYPLPSPRLRKVCRFLVEQGANLVVCQHSHCAGAYEAYGGGHIIYGQGNLISDSPDRDATWHEGFLIKLTIAPDRKASWQPIPYAQAGSAPGARRMPPERERAFLNDLAERSRAIEDDEFVAHMWAEFCRNRQHSIMSFVLGHGRLRRRLNRNGGLVRLMHHKQRLRELKNCIICDTHREVVLAALDRYLDGE